jgi:hypothetical protein
MSSPLSDRPRLGLTVMLIRVCVNPQCAEKAVFANRLMPAGVVKLQSSRFELTEVEQFDAVKDVTS